MTKRIRVTQLILVLIPLASFLSVPVPVSSFVFERAASHEPQQAVVRELVPERPIEQGLAGGEAQSYHLALGADQYLHVVVEQQGIDVVVKLFGPDGRQLVEVDSPTGARGAETVLALTEASGTYRLEVRALEKEAAPGRYEVKIEELRAALPQDQTRIKAERIFGEGKSLRAHGTAESLRKAIEKYEEALLHYRAIEENQGEARTLYEIGSIYSSLGEKQKALEYYNQTLPLWRVLGDPRPEATTLNSIGSAYWALGEGQKALEYFGQALPLRRATEDRRGEAITLHNIGTVYNELGETQEALEYFGQALPLLRALGDRRGEATTLNNIGLIHSSLGEKQKALEHYREALGLLHEAGDRRGETRALHNIGAVYSSLGEYQKALSYFNRALPLFQTMGDRRGEAHMLHNIGVIHSRFGDPQKALDSYNRALTLRRAMGDRRGEAHTLHNIGSGYLRLGEQQAALDSYNQALALSQTMKDRYWEAYALSSIGEVYADLGEMQKALAYYGQALTLRRAVRDQRGEAMTLAGIARVERERGNLAEAHARMKEALGLIESLRSEIASQELRSSYFASNLDYYEFYTDLLMRLHHREPAKGHNAAALQASERARARSLLEILTESHADIRRGVDAELLNRERRLQQQLNVKAERLTRLLSGKPTEEQTAAAQKEVEMLLEQYRDVQGKIRVQSPRYAALTQPQPLSAQQIQQQVLDEDTLLLEYALGEERSFLWAVTPTSITSVELPKRKEIEGMARRAYELLTARNQRVRFETAVERGARLKRADREYREVAAGLSKILLGPVAEQLGTKRLVIVADGALQYLPFAALPKPVDRGSWIVDRGSNDASRITNHESRITNHQPLIADHEIINLPSASVLAVLRRELAGRPSAPKAVAVLADPVFDTDDERVEKEIGNQKPETREKASTLNQRSPSPNAQSLVSQPPFPVSNVEQAARGAGLDRFDRVPFTRREAEQIVAFAPTKENLTALDFVANRATATSEELSQYRLVHFATHGLINSEHPELSGLVLSLVDEQGQPQDGFLRLHEIYNLKLPAEVVVLSACRTALGKEVKGEGLIGLTRGFMYAGAARVVASLWDVADESTAELMKRFYSGMLRERLRPAAALRAAQVSMWKAKRWTAPYYWAAFVLQGEWK